MRHIYQHYMSDCWPTCVAMISGLSHRQCLDLMHPFHVKGEAYYTSDDHAIFILRQLGFKVRKRYIKDFTNLKDIAVLLIDGEEYQNQGHVVVWDPVQKLVLDPAKTNSGSSLEYYQSALEFVYIIT